MIIRLPLLRREIECNIFVIAYVTHHMKGLITIVVEVKSDRKMSVVTVCSAHLKKINAY